MLLLLIMYSNHGDSVHVRDLHAEYLSTPICRSPSSWLPLPQWCSISDPLPLEHVHVRDMLAAAFFWSGRERHHVGHHRVQHRPLITICMTAIADLSLEEPTCETRSRRSQLQRDIVVSRLTSMLSENNRPWRSKPCWPLVILDVEAYLSLFMHKESFTSNLSSSIVRSVRSTLMFRGPGLFNSFAILLYRLNIILCWCHPFIIRVQYYGFLFGQLEFPLPVYSSRAQDLVSPCM